MISTACGPPDSPNPSPVPAAARSMLALDGKAAATSSTTPETTDEAKATNAGFEYRCGTLSWTAPPMISIRKKHIMARPMPAADDPNASICSDSR
jgi:hypothetical protein